MTVKRFVANSARECLRRVKAELGPDAIVVSNKPIEGGVEITAMSAASLEALSNHAMPKAANGGAAQTVSRTVTHPGLAAYTTSIDTTIKPAVEPEHSDDYTLSLSANMNAQKAHQPVDWAALGRSSPTRPVAEPALTPRPRPLPPRETRAPEPQVQQPFAAQQAAVAQAAPKPAQVAPQAAAELPPVQTPQVAAQTAQLMEEMQLIKSLLERQLAGFAWGEMSRESPARAQLLGELIDAGFSGQFSRKLVEDLPADMQLEEARKWVRVAVGRRLRTLSPEDDLIDRGGVYALVGPTGVGKTTTTAKLAARCVVRYGAEKLALLTTDSYRIGAHEQLRIYGRILGVPVHVVRDAEDLRHTLSDLRDKHMVLIDTVGMSQRDRMVAEQAAMLARCGQVNRLLLLNATSRGDTLDDVVRSYAGEDLVGCIITKIDETATIAPALDTVIRHGLLTTYLATGQRVPEDLHLPNRNYLLHRAFKTPSDASPHHLQDDEVGLAVATSKAAEAMSAAMNAESGARKFGAR